MTKEYPFIIAWGRELGSYTPYIVDELEAAAADKAPFHAVYRRSSGEWATVHEVKSPELRARLALDVVEILRK